MITNELYMDRNNELFLVLQSKCNAIRNQGIYFGVIYVSISKM